MGAVKSKEKSLEQDRLVFEKIAEYRRTNPKISRKILDY